MRRNRRWLAAAAAAAAGTISLAACGGSTSPATARQAASKVFTYDTFTQVMVDGWDPATEYSDGIIAMSQMYEGLTRYDPATHTLCWAQAGHPPPLHTRCGSTTVLPRPKGPLLGALDRARYATATLTLDPGDLILLYTDGLVEHPDHTPADGLRPVIDTLNRISTSDSRQPVVDLLDHLHRANPADDTCMVAVRRLPHDGQP